MNGFHIHSPSECGGSKKITIGDVIHFRIAKNHAYISIDQGKEQKLSVLSKASNEAPGKEEPTHKASLAKPLGTPPLLSSKWTVTAIIGI